MFWDDSDKKLASPPSTMSAGLLSASNAAADVIKKRFPCQKCSLIFESSVRLRNHRKSVHALTVQIKSSAGKELVTLKRNSATMKFHCVCGSQFQSTTNSYHHRKCYENSISASTAEEGKTIIFSRKSKALTNLLSLLNFFYR